MLQNSHDIPDQTHTMEPTDPPSNDTSQVMFNYKMPKARKGGGLVICPNFNFHEFELVHEGRLAEARNSEAPLLLTKAGETTSAEDASAQYTRIKAKQPIFVGNVGEEVFTADMFDEKRISEDPDIWNKMMKLRKMVCRRGEGAYHGHSAFELLLAGGSITKTTTTGRKPKSGTKTNPSTNISTIAPMKRRDYALGMLVNPQEQAMGAAPTNKRVVEDPSLVGKFMDLVADVSCYCIRKCAPKEDLKLLDHQADIDVPATFGHKENKLFTTGQLNISPMADVALTVSLGPVGGLHIDFNDDFRRWTVLLSLDNIPKDYWPGRTLITSLRIYAVMAPMTALVFKGVHPHISLPPKAMGDSRRSPYQPSIPVEELDPELYLNLRVKIPVYAKQSAHNNSTTLIRNLTPEQYLKKGDPQCYNPDALPPAIAAFGNIEQQMSWHARTEAVRKVRLSQLNPNVVLPSAQAISEMWSWKDADGNVRITDPAEVQKVIDLNSDLKALKKHREELEDYARRCFESLSQKWFNGNYKSGNITWVESDQLGTSFENFALSFQAEGKSGKKKDRILTLYGPLPYLCSHCDRRYVSPLSYKAHFRSTHTDFEWEPVEPTADPNRAPDEPKTTLDVNGKKTQKPSDVRKASDVSDAEAELDGDETVRPAKRKKG